MDTPQQGSASEPSTLSAALDRLWERHLPEIEERLAAIESAVTATGSGTLSPGQRQAAHAAAHKLAGVLGAFGLTKGTGPAQEIERLYAAETPVSREDGPRLAGMAAVLRSLVESRKLRQSPGK